MRPEAIDDDPTRDLSARVGVVEKGKEELDLRVVEIIRRFEFGPHQVPCVAV
jgi:hypothetical protein